MSSYTVNISDPQDLINSDIERQLYQAGTYVAELIGTYVDWKGTMDLEIRVADHA